MAPEILKGQLYTELVDMWAMGVVTYIMLCGFPPFDGDSDTDVMCNIMNISYEFPSPGLFGVGRFYSRDSRMGRQIRTC